MLNPDTRIVLHALAGSLTAREAQLLGADAWDSGAVLWEIAMSRSSVASRPISTILC